MLTKHELREMRMLSHRLQSGSVSREDWSNLAALALVYQGDAVLIEIAAGGLDAFIATAEPLYRGHAFEYRDYQRIFERVCEAAGRHSHDLVPQ